MVESTQVDIAFAEHRQAVEELRRQYAALPTDTPVRLTKPTSNLYRTRQRHSGPSLDVRHLDRVLSVDPESRTAEVQGMATYETIADATLAQGMLPPVVLDCKTITIGGGVAGTGAESSSFRGGLPHDGVREMDILTGDGRVVTATRENEHAELFNGFAHSYGSLGYALRLRLELEPAKRYVRLRHIHTASAREWVDTLLEIDSSGEYHGIPVDFVDGAYFAEDAVHLVLADYTDDPPFVSDYTGQRIYYRTLRTRSQDYLTTRDYLWRWDTDLYWTSKLFGLENPLVRRLWPRRYRNAEMFRKIQMRMRQSGLADRATSAIGRPVEWVLQDADLPVESVPDFLEFFAREIGISPVWLCPMRLRTPATLYPIDRNRLYVSVGFWWPLRQRVGEAPDYHNRLIERAIAELGGHKPLYSTAHYTEKEFWRHYGGDTYRKLEETYDPDNRLPDLYDKCVKGR
ncbi:FAD-binding oxidoreductase [Nocardia uniformis]|uniref:Delta(24)-sterol reductase n=1 Tax=Nocardia uniformis TaxID=53432 RepID=A0A849BTT2_9NOCA|nr:FAD-binding oxidoreductase [Nocardia uniformis]NNH69554.1 FAD-binding oxidoreductase [Nocardia uniformis]